MATVASNTAGLNSSVSVRRRSFIIAENADGGQVGGAARPSLIKQVNLVMMSTKYLRSRRSRNHPMIMIAYDDDCCDHRSWRYNVVARELETLLLFLTLVC